MGWADASPYGISHAVSLPLHTHSQTAAACLTLALSPGPPPVQQDSSSCLPGLL